MLTSNVRCQSTAKNLALQKASGKYVCFLDIDDAVSNDLLSSYPINEDYDFYFSNWKKIKNNKKSIIDLPTKSGFLERSHITLIQKWIFGEVKSKNPLSIDVFSSNCGKLYKTSIIRNNNISFVPMKLIGGSEDAIFNMEYLNYAMCGFYVKKELYYYYSHNNSYTHNRHLSSLFLYFSQYHIMKNLIKKMNLDDGYYIALKNRLILVSLPVFIVASRLAVSKKEKFKFYKKYLSYEEFNDAVNSFNTNNFYIFYRIIYHFLIKKHYRLLYYILRITDIFYGH